MSVSNPKTIKEKKQNLIRILSYNVNFGSCYDASSHMGSDVNTAVVLQAIHESKADVVCLQETHAGWEQAASQLKEAYPYQVWKHSDSEFLASGLAVLVSGKHKLLAVHMHKPQVEGSFFFPGMCARVCMNVEQKNKKEKKEKGEKEEKKDDEQQRTIDIVNVHLRPPLPMGNGSLWSWNTVKAFMYETTAIRKQELTELVSVFQRPGLVVGDCNEGTGGDGYKWMIGPAAYADAVSVANTSTTWYWPVIGKFSLWAGYDHIFYDTRRFSVLNCHVMTQYKHASDHLPVVATIGW